MCIVAQVSAHSAASFARRSDGKHRGHRSHRPGRCVSLALFAVQGTKSCLPHNVLMPDTPASAHIWSTEHANSGCHTPIYLAHDEEYVS